MIIDSGLIIIGEASQKLRGAFGDVKSSNKIRLKKPPPRQEMTLPEIDNFFFTVDDFRESQTPGPKPHVFDGFLDNSYEVKCTFSHEGQSMDPILLKMNYDRTVKAMERSPHLESSFREKRSQLFRKINKRVPTFQEYKNMKPYF